MDNQTEEAVMDAIYNLSSDITIILIAHRLGTVKNCDEIFLLSKGALKAQGSFEELKKNNKFFSKFNLNCSQYFKKLIKKDIKFSKL